SWDAVDEREWKIESAAKARRKGRGPARWPESPGLSEDLEAGRLISGHELRELAGTAYGQPVISLYLNLTPDKVGRESRVYLSVFNSMRHSALAARQDLIDGLSAQQR